LPVAGSQNSARSRRVNSSTCPGRSGEAAPPAAGRRG
jgi:hypothetical protein